MQDAVARNLASVMSPEGWAKLSGPSVQQSFQEQVRQQRAALAAQAGIVADTFKTQAGVQCLDMLVRNVLLHNQLRPMDERLALDQQALYAARREGQNSVIALILNALAVARGEQPEMTEGT